MASRRDQLHSYQFMIQRVVAALVMRETDPAQSPFRRAAGAIFAGIMVGIIVIAGFAIYGLWKPGGNMAWKAEADASGKPAVVVEEETGAVYVYMGKKLHPMENITSAMLLGNLSPSGEPYYVSRNSLANEEPRIPRGPRLGIPGAPDSLPSQDNITTDAWTLCTKPKVTASGDEKRETLMVVGDTGQFEKTWLDYQGNQEQLMLVEEEDSTDKYFIYKSHRFKITDQNVVLNATGLEAEQPLTVTKAWINALPAGQDIEPLEIPGAGEPSNVRDDTSVGQIFVVRSTDQYYVALEDEFAVITELQARLLETSTGEEPIEMHSSEVGGQSPTQELLPENLHRGLAVPPTSGQLNTVSPSSSKAACAIFNPYDNRARPPQMAYDVSLGISDNEGAITKETGEEGESLASRVVVNPGKGAFVRAGSQLCLVTDTGKYYTLPSEAELQKLGYLADTPIGSLPSSLVARLPRGPALDPDDAAVAIQE